MQSSIALTLLPSNRFGCQRDWAWRGWQIRYTYIRNAHTDRPPIVLLHGFGSSLGQWRSNLLPLSQHHTVYALDFLGFGASQKAPDRYNVKLWAQLVRDFCQSFIGQPAIIVGHSLGALVALTVVADNPNLATHLALFTLPDVLPSQAPKFARTLEKLFANPILLAPLFWFVRRPQCLRWVLQKKIYLLPELVDDELVWLVAKPPRDRGALDVFCRLAQSRSHDEAYAYKGVREMLPTLTLPVLLIWGKQDRIVPLSGFYKLLGIRSIRALPDHVSLLEVQQAGHCTYDEYPESINRQLLSWIQTGNLE
jgi:pimeloyl-ACP methyl ester carboxylesterase